MVEYILVLGSIVLGANFQSFFDLDSATGRVFALVAGVALFIIGYLIRGTWGAIIALSIGTVLFLYLKGFLPI